MSFKHFLADHHLSQTQITSVIELAKAIKADPGAYSQSLQGKSIVMLFEKPSLRTHISFDIGIQKLGGHALYIGQQNGQLGARERIKDVALNLACWSDAIVARVFKQEVLDELAQHSAIPVINALSDQYHPCQAMADFLTLSEHFSDLQNRTIAYVGDGNNVANSLLLVAAQLGVNAKLVCPPGHSLTPAQQAQILQQATLSGAEIEFLDDITELKQADVIYTDTWISMGDNTDIAKIEQVFAPFQVNHQLMQQTGAQYFLHCQPAHLGQEISEDLFDSDYSLASVQAENRMWAQNAILVKLLGEN